MLSQHALQVVSEHTLQQVLGGGGVVGGIRACLAGFQAHTQRGSLGGSGRGVSSPTAKGEVEGDLVQAHSQGGSCGPGQHPRGKLRGIWPGDACSGVCGDPPMTATAAGGMHPTGMHSCFKCFKY